MPTIKFTSQANYCTIKLECSIRECYLSQVNNENRSRKNVLILATGIICYILYIVHLEKLSWKKTYHKGNMSMFEVDIFSVRICATTIVRSALHKWKIVVWLCEIKKANPCEILISANQCNHIIHRKQTAMYNEHLVIKTLKAAINAPQ